MLVYHASSVSLCRIIIIQHKLQWLSEDFLSYLSEWEESVEAREDVDDAEKAIMLLNTQTSYGLKMTGIL